ncbi:MAG: molecular chaperone [Gammaproteobacteria bacterium]
MGAIAALVWALFTTSASASMVLSNVIVHFEPNAPARQDIDIQNSGDEPLYIEIKPHQIFEAGSVNEHRELIRDPRQAGLLVTPNRLVIAPGARKRLRVVNLKPGDVAERIYRIAVTPVVGELNAQESGLKVLIGYEVLVLAQPAAPQPNLFAQRVGQALHFENRGNTNVLLREGHQCEHDAEPLELCQALASKRLYPGNRWQVALPFDRPAQYQLGIGTQHETKIYP